MGKGPTTADHIAASEGSNEPQRANNFQLVIDGLPGGTGDSDVIFLSINNLTIPRDVDDKITIRWGNEERHVSGNTTMEDMPISLHDYVDNALRQVLVAWRKLVYDPGSGAKGLARNYKKKGWIWLFAPDGIQFKRICEVQGIWPTAGVGGNLTMEGGKVEIELPLSVDKALWSFS